MARRSRNNRGYERSDRVGSTLRELISDELNRIDDDTVDYVTVTDVVVDNELSRARVYFSTLNLEEADLDGVREHAGRIKRAVAQRARIRRVPHLEFLIDPGLISGNRVDEILRGMADDRAFAAPDGDEEE